jgi:Protein of unknown function (DUF1566)/Repeat of unknown function (DUF5648)
MNTLTLRRARPTVWFAAVALSALLAACGGSQSGDANDKASASAADTETRQQTAAASTALARGAALSSAELKAAEQQALAADASASNTASELSIPLDELPAGQIAAKSAYTSGAIARKAAAVRIPVYRFFNGSTGAHFFTTNTTERDTVVNTLSPPFNLEGTAFSVASDFSPGLSPVHRFFNTQTGVHFYTISEEERANVVATLPHFNYEGVAYHASQVAGAGLIPFYRFFVPSKGFHFYTANEAEKDSIIANLSAVYHFEGVGYHVLDTDWRAEKLPHTGVTSSQCYQGGSEALLSCSSTLVTDFNSQQDGHRASINAMSYSAVGGRPLTSCVEDNITGLVWEGKEVSGTRAGSNTYTNSGGGAITDTSGYVAAVNTANLCGFNDWRLPTRQELLNLVDFGRSTIPKLNTTAFPNTSTSSYWTSEVKSTERTQAWGVSFASSGSSSFTRSSSLALRLVRGSAPATTRFTYSTIAYAGDANNNLVNDAWTGLQWRRCEEGQVWSGSTCDGFSSKFSHEQALGHARSQSGWRLPNVKELATVTDLSVGHISSIDQTVFPSASNDFIRASSPFVEVSDFAWIVGSGVVTFDFRSRAYVVRLVRASQ